MVEQEQQQQPSCSKGTQEFLSRVLSRRGSSSLPYDEDMKSVISQHLISLKEANPFVVLGTKKFITDKRKPPLLLHARLNIPMVYQNVTYYLPVAFWLTKLYPRYAPHVRVYPTRDMVRKRDHPFVNPLGYVTIDYLQNWVYPTCNLVDLCPRLSEAFALDPPLYSKGRPDPNPHFSTSPSVKSNLEPPKPSVKSNSEQPKPTSSSSTFVPHGEGDRISPNLSLAVTGTANSNLTRQFLERVFALVEERKKQWEAVMSEWPLVQNGLQMTDGEGLEQQLERVLKTANVLRSLVINNEQELSGAAVKGVSGDEPVYVFGLLKQMLECTAYDLAITDVEGKLDGVFQQEIIPFDVYLKVVRLLSRQQFMHRAMAIKVHVTLTTMMGHAMLK